MRHLLPLALAVLAGCTTTTINCTRGDVLTPYGSFGNVTKTPGMRSCAVIVKKRGLIDAAQAETIKKVLEAGE